MTTSSLPPLERDLALELCEEIRHEYRGRWWTLAGLQCWGCVTFTGGDASKFCFNSAPGFRGCALVNARYNQLLKPATHRDA